MGSSERRSRLTTPLKALMRAISSISPIRSCPAVATPHNTTKPRKKSRFNHRRAELRRLPQVCDPNTHLCRAGCQPNRLLPERPHGATHATRDNARGTLEEAGRGGLKPLAPLAHRGVSRDQPPREARACCQAQPPRQCRGAATAPTAVNIADPVLEWLRPAAPGDEDVARTPWAQPGRA